jgi:DNA polymerase-3 subunit gamma/tau
VPSPAVASPAIARTPGAGGAGLAPRAAAAPAADPVADPVAEPVADPADFAGLVRLFRDRREVVVASQLETSVHVVRFEPGRFEFRPGPSAPTDLAQRVGRLLGAWTGRRWVVAVSGEVGQPTLKESTNAADRADRDRAAENALVKAALAAFPGAAVTAVRKLGGAAPALSPAADSEAEDGALGEAPPVEAYDLDEELA